METGGDDGGDDSGDMTHTPVTFLHPRDIRAWPGRGRDRGKLFVRARRGFSLSEETGASVSQIIRLPPAEAVGSGQPPGRVGSGQVRQTVAETMVDSEEGISQHFLYGRRRSSEIPESEDRLSPRRHFGLSWQAERSVHTVGMPGTKSETDVSDGQTAERPSVSSETGETQEGGGRV